MFRRSSLLITILLFLPAARVQAHGGGGGSGHGHSAGSDLGQPSPKKKNETPGDVRLEQGRLVMEREGAVQQNAPPAVIREIDRKLEVVGLRLRIAEKRRERDEMRERGESEEADRVDLEIHGLKNQLAEKQSAHPSSSKR